MNNMKTNYEKQAEGFLAKHGIKFRATLSDSKVAPWKPEVDGKSGHHYRVTMNHTKACYIANGRSKNYNGRLVFDFWGCIADAEKGITTVTPYDVLACISSDSNCPNTFEDFCAEFGYGEDSIKALQMFKRCSAFAKRLQAFFTKTEIAELSEIN